MAANNQGIMHLRTGGWTIACKRRDAHMATEIENFRTDPRQCKRCAAFLARRDERAARKALKAEG